MATETCGICELEADILLLQSCFRCDTSYHLNPSSKEPGIDCGDAILGAELGVYYYCNPCLDVINEEETALMAQQMHEQMLSGAIQLQPGWRMPDLVAPTKSEAPPPRASASMPPPPRAPGAQPRRRFRRIDQ